jgi:hypothetical protein
MNPDILKERLELIESTTTLLTTEETKHKVKARTCITQATKFIQEWPDEAKKIWIKKQLSVTYDVEKILTF